MSHALIIEGNMVISHVLEKRLSGVGFNSFDHAWTEQQAVEFATRRFPDMIIVGEDLERGSGIAAARTISEARSVPILLVTADQLRRHMVPPASARLAGPYPIDQIETAVSAARAQPWLYSHNDNAAAELD